MKKYLKIVVACFLFFLVIAKTDTANVYAGANFNISIGAGEGETEQSSTATSLQIIFVLAIISLAPSLLVMLTCFTRIIIALHFLRSALGTQQMPPNQVMVGLALILTFFLMEPQLTDIYNNAFMPYSRSEMTASEALSAGMEPIRDFMLMQTDDKNISLFAGLTGQTYQDWSEIPNRVLIPAFILNEITAGFVMGFWVYIPFIAIDMIVSSTLMAMGMMMLPPAMISLPFKILLFVMVDGWAKVIQSIVGSFTFQ